DEAPARVDPFDRGHERATLPDNVVRLIAAGKKHGVSSINDRCGAVGLPSRRARRNEYRLHRSEVPVAVEEAIVFGAVGSAQHDDVTEPRGSGAAQPPAHPWKHRVGSFL